MAINNCNNLDNLNKSIQNRLPVLNGGTLVSPTLTVNELCGKYISAMRIAGIYKGYPSGPIDTKNQNKMDVNNLQQKNIGSGFVPELVDSIRIFLGRNPNASELEVCSEFSRIKQNLPASSLVSNIPSPILNTINNRLQKPSNNFKYFIAAAQIIGQDYVEYTLDNNSKLPTGAELNVRSFPIYNPRDATSVAPPVMKTVDDFAKQQEISKKEFLKKEIDNIKETYNKVNNHINKVLSDIRNLYAQNRILPVTSDQIDKNGNVIQGTVLIEVPEGIDLTKVQSLPPEERNKVIDRIKKESKPLRNPFDADELSNANITDIDLKQYGEVLDKINEIGSDDLLFTGMYPSALNVKTKTALTSANIETARIISRIKNGSATEEDYKTIQNNGFKESVKELGASLKSSDIQPKSKNPLIGTIKGLTIGGASGAVYLTETMIQSNTAAEIAANYMIAQLSSVKNAAEFNSSLAVRSGVVPPVDSSKRFTLRKSHIDKAIQRVTRETHVKSAHHFLHKIGTLFPIAGSIYYGWQTYKDIEKLRQGGGITPELLKNGALTAVEILSVFHALKPTPAFGISAGIYFGYYAYKYSSAATEVDQEKQKNDALANAAGIVPSLYQYGIVVNNDILVSAISKMDTDPSNDINVVRAGDPYVKTVETPYSYVDWRAFVFKAPYYFSTTQTGQNPQPEDIASAQIPFTPINVYSDPFSLVVTQEGETKKNNSKDIRTQHRCKCCGSCDSKGNLIEFGDRVTYSPECFAIFLSYAMIGDDDPYKSGQERLCGSKGGCFTFETKVLTPKGELQISEIKVGDDVICFDENGNLFESKVTETFKHEDKQVHLYVFSDGYTVNSTKNHPFYTKNGFTEIGNLNIGESVIDINGKEIYLLEIIDMGIQSVFNIEVEKYHTYIANGIRVHNKFNPQARLDALRELPPQPQEEWTVGNPWPQPPVVPSSYGELDKPASSWTRICTENITNPLIPPPKNKNNSAIMGKAHNWTCKYRWNGLDTQLGPLISDGPFGGYGDAYGTMDLVDVSTIPIPVYSDINPIETNPQIYGPVYEYSAQPSNPYFNWEESNIETYLSSYPFYLNEQEIQLVKNGNPSEIQSYFDGKDPNDKNNLKSYHLTLIGVKFVEIKKQEKRNRLDRITYIDCLTSNAG
jgi:hypothetical protein